MLSDLDWSALWVTLRLSGATVLVLLIVGTPLAWWLAHTRSRFRVVVEAVVALPIVLPPTVLGFYILVALGPYGPIGHFTGLTLAFTFWGLVIGSAFYSMPFVIQPFFLGTPVYIILRFPDILPATGKSQGFETHGFQGHIPGKDHQVGPGYFLTVFLFNRPEQSSGFIKISVIRPTVLRCETVLT